MLTGTVTVGHSFASGDWRGSSCEFRGETLERNVKVADRLKRFAVERDCTVSQLATAWSLVKANIAGGHHRRAHARVPELMGMYPARWTQAVPAQGLCTSA